MVLNIKAFLQTHGKRKIILSASAFFALIFFIIFSQGVKESATIWIMTRYFGLFAFFSLFLGVILGELRLLSEVKGNFTLFRFHKPIVIFSLTLVFLHFISAITDKFKWGKVYSFTQFLGFTFTDKWMVYLSFGALAFYLMIIISFTSAKKRISFIGFKKWRVLHYISYIAFIIAYIHSINLGTDIKHSAISFLLYPLFLGMFISVTSLLIVRAVKSTGILKTRFEIKTAAALLMIMMAFAPFFINQLSSKEDKIAGIEKKVESMQNEIKYYENKILNITYDSKNNINNLEVINNGQQK